MEQIVVERNGENYIILQQVVQMQIMMQQQEHIQITGVKQME